MFCAKCGTQYSDEGKFCPVCGTPNSAAAQQPVEPQPVQPVYQQPAEPQQPVYQQPVEPQYQQPVYQAPVRQPIQVAPATAYQKKMAVIIALISVFALVVGFLHTFCLVDVPMSVDVELDLGSLVGSAFSSYDDYYDYDDYGYTSIMPSSTPSMEFDGSVGNIYVSPAILSEAFDLVDSTGVIDASFTAGYIGIIVFGVINLLIAVVGILYYLRARNNMPLYDKLCGGFIKAKSPALILGLAGVVSCLLQIVLMWLTGIEYSAMGQSLGISVGVHWITWVALIVYGGLAGSQLLAIKNDEA